MRHSFKASPKDDGWIAQVGKRLKRADLFSESIPTFNIAGKEKVQTYLGGTVSLGLFYTTFLFALLKFKHMSEFKSPSIASFKQTLHEEDPQAFYPTTKDSFMIALGIEHFLEGVKDDPTFAQWIVTYNHVDPEDGIFKQETYPMHRCTAEDFEKFYPPEHDTEIKVRRLRERGGLYCADLEDIDAELHGTWQTGTHYQALDF